MSERTSDPWDDDPQVQRWVAHVRHQVLPMIERSALSAIVTPSGEPDIKIAVELGLSILLDKPLLVMVAPGQHVPAALRRAADRVIEGPAAVQAQQVREWLDAHDA